MLKNTSVRDGSEVSVQLIPDAQRRHVHPV